MAGQQGELSSQEWRDAVLSSWGDDVWGTDDDVPRPHPAATETHPQR